MAKRADSKYLSGARTDNWLKIKTSKRQEVVIAGFTAPRRTPPFFGALTLAFAKSTAGAISAMSAQASATRSSKSCTQAHKAQDGKITVRQKKERRGRHDLGQASARCEVKFTEWTSSGEMRHPVYLGLREDRRAEDATREREEHRADKKARGPRS